MLLLLLVLAVAYFILTLVMQTMVKTGNLGKTYSTLSLIQGLCMGASLGILAILVIKGRTIG